MPTKWKTKTDTGNATLTACKEAMLADLKNAVADASDLLKDMADAGAEEFTAMRSKLGTTPGEARAAATDNARGASKQATVTSGATPGRC